MWSLGSLVNHLLFRTPTVSLVSHKPLKFLQAKISDLQKKEYTHVFNNEKNKKKQSIRLLKDAVLENT